MKRRTFLGVISGGAVAGLAGCTGNRYPTGFLYGLLSTKRSSEETRSNIVSEGIREKNIYINDFIGAVQLSGDYNKLENLVEKLDFRKYRLYPVREEIPILSNDQAQIDIGDNGLREFEGLRDLAGQTSSSNVSVGMIDTNADWSSWYDKSEVNHRPVAQNMNPILGPILGDKDHGKYTAQTLFHPQQKIKPDRPSIRGLVSESTAYHAEISAIVTVSQFFRSLCESLEWMAKKNVDVVTMPLSTVNKKDDVLPQLLEDFVTDLSDSIIVVSAGNVDVCDGEINALADTDVREIVGVGAIEYSRDGFDVSGHYEVSDILGPSGFTITEDRKYSGTSASSTVIAGVLGRYISTLKENYSQLSMVDYRECALTGLLDESNDVKIYDCDSDVYLSRINVVQGLERAKDEAEV